MNRRSRRRTVAATAAAVAVVIGPAAGTLGPQPSYVTPNPHLADSPWPTYHQSNYAQASTPLAGPRPGRGADVQFTETELPGDGYSQATSPWSNLSPEYPDGSRVVWGTTLDHVFKTVVDGDTFETVATHPLPVTTPIWDNFSHWNNLVLADNTIIVGDRTSRTFFRYGDADPTDARSPIVVRDEWTLPASVPGLLGAFNVSYDGRLIFLTDAGIVASVRPDFTDLVTFRFPTGSEEFALHNGFPIDEDGSMYHVTDSQMLRLDWTGSDFELVWSVPYDSKGGGWNGAKGSGTTPTLVGGPDDPDRLVVVVDAKSPSNLVAFWRDEIPADWPGLPGHDRRVAAVVSLPDIDADPAVENSVVARGYDMAVARWNGFAPGCRTDKGVNQLSWDPATNTMSVSWRNTEVNMNGVMTYSGGTDLVYGSGREGCTYYFYGLDWDTGDVVVRIRLGRSDMWLDQGNNTVIDADGSAIFGTAQGIARIRR